MRKEELSLYNRAIYYFYYSSLDLGLPLWIGGAPEIEGFSEGVGITTCISNFTINNQLLDLEDYVDEVNSARGCEQVGVVTVANNYRCVTNISLMVAVSTHVWKACVQWNGMGTNAMVGVTVTFYILLYKYCHHSNRANHIHWRWLCSLHLVG